MTFEEIQRRAATLPPAEQASELQSLGTDPRLAAVLALLGQFADGMISDVCQQRMAGDPGKQSHGLGSVFALREFRGVLLAAAQPPPKPSRPAPEE